MLGKKLLIVVLLVLGTVLGGCSAIPIKPYSSACPQLERNVTVLDKDLDGNAISEKQIIDAIKNHMLSVGYKGDDSSRYTDNLNYINGVNASNTAALISISYYNGLKSTYSNPTEYSTKVIASYPCNISKTDTGYNVLLKTPEQLFVQPARGPIGLEEPTYASFDNLGIDLVTKLNSITDFAIKRAYSLKGEVNSEFAQTAILANFERKLGKYDYRNQTSSFEEAKAKVFSYKLNGEDIPVYVKVFPYRNGSKVAYNMAVPYKVNESISISMKDIKDIREYIEKVVND